MGFLTIAILVGLFSCAADQRVRLMPEDIDSSFAAAAVLYGQHCAACHGPTGEGNGRAYTTFDGTARNFRFESIRYISTTSAGAPSDEDLVRTIHRGLEHSRMPAWPQLDDTQALQLALYIREIRRQGVIEQLKAPAESDEDDEEYEDDDDEGGYEDEDAMTPEEIEQLATEWVAPGPTTVVPLRPVGYRSDIRLGQKLFAESCATCHGARGRGDGNSTLKDDLGIPIRPRDLTSRAFRGGSSDSDLYWRIRCGLPGTPMPGFGSFTDEQVWQLIDYVRALSKGRR